MAQRETLSAQDRERQHIVDYMASEACGEAVEHLEKVKTERVLGRQMDAWDVHTNKNRWWVITAPTNLYLQTQFPSLEVAISFHVGLMARVAERQDRTARPEQAARFPKAWRAWEQAGDAVDEADEAEEFQAVGMRCRESLLAFAMEAAPVSPTTVDEALPKTADFIGWTNRLGDTIAAGGSAERRRGYLKAIGKSAWELVNWLTHARDASPFDAYFAHEATRHVLDSWSSAIMRFQFGIPQRCPICASYRLATYSKTGRSVVRHFTTCDACGWTSKPHKEAVSPHPRPRRKASASPSADASPCVFVEVPLKGPTPPRPTVRRRRRRG
jgi:hypothetical protein